LAHQWGRAFGLPGTQLARPSRYCLNGFPGLRYVATRFDKIAISFLKAVALAPIADYWL